MKKEITPEERGRLEYTIDKVLAKISGIVTRLDGLLFVLSVVSIFGLANLNIIEKSTEPIELPFGFFIPLNFLHPALALALLIMFGLLGSHLISYMKNRSLFDKYCDQYWPFDDEKAGPFVQKYSDILIKSNFYEWMYRLDVSFKELHLPVTIFLFILIFFSHFISLIHAAQISDNLFLNSTFVILLFVSYFSLYRTFVISVKRYKVKLSEILRKIMLWILFIASLGTCVYFIFINFFV